MTKSFKLKIAGMILFSSFVCSRMVLAQAEESESNTKIVAICAEIEALTKVIDAYQGALGVSGLSVKTREAIIGDLTAKRARRLRLNMQVNYDCPEVEGAELGAR